MDSVIAKQCEEVLSMAKAFRTEWLVHLVVPCTVDFPLLVFPVAISAANMFAIVFAIELGRQLLLTMLISIMIWCVITNLPRAYCDDVWPLF